MSDKHNIAIRDRLIVALDVPTYQAALDLVSTLGSTVSFYKIGLELFMSGKGFRLLDDLSSLGKKVFVDLKFFDVPQTVGAAVAQLGQYPAIQFTTIHGNDAMLKAAVANRSPNTKLLAVTVLTSLDRGDLDALGFDCDVQALVVSRARRACAIGCDGVVASGQEASAIKQALGDGLLIVVPGIRPVANDDDQKRTVDVATAFSNGADYIVVGRPITCSSDPQQSAAEMIDTIQQQFLC